jgi:hypothetical protein
MFPHCRVPGDGKECGMFSLPCTLQPGGIGIPPVAKLGGRRGRGRGGGGGGGSGGEEGWEEGHGAVNDESLREGCRCRSEPVQ